MNILLLNGPAGSGKDEIVTAINVLNPNEMIGHEKFANPLRWAIRGLHQIYSDSVFEKFKRSHPDIRKLMIGLSEDVVKPTLGMDWFAKNCAARITGALSSIDTWIVSDCGFQYELDAFIEAMEKALDCEKPPRFELWCIHRFGCSYQNDSRSSVFLDPRKGKTIDIFNNGTKGQLNMMVDYHFDAFLNNR